ncbi:helix-turn-helix domain-containing protein [Streptomyces sp. SID13666]|uniref:MmyB family transcriptional regulator n=1 Tax=unclassified Streptomyces TaxID=2593676 RepID=UPI0013BF2C73|nr:MULTISPECIES: helix-turn-helix domain-containing protein [unclassified Streptomyces]NEA56618.1 helix-turn-helix domain-containing protein [Streptomyces sp. SID13666]NEA73062.1 helix-turn-helix domain-containing protein [Streptomyces sp. SID13588]
MGTAMPGPADEPLTPGQLMGLAGLLRAWRAVAGEKRGLGRSMSQAEVVSAVGGKRSLRWYQQLESGAKPKLDRPVLDALADALLLGRDERQALLLYAVDGALPTIPAPRADDPTRRMLQLLLDHQMPSPTYLTDARWNIIGYNPAMAAWWPWVMEPGANLIRWACLTKEARTQFVDWPLHAAEYLKLLRFASARHPHDTELAALIADVRRDPECARIWDDGVSMSENRDGAHFRVALPALKFEIIEVVSHVLYPASLPDCRLTVITWLRDDTEPEIHPQHSDTGTGAIARGQETESAAPMESRRREAVARQLSQHLSVESLEEATALAGPDAIPLPLLSELVGKQCRLTISPSTQSVIWAVQQDDGRWGISVLDPYAVIVRIPHGSVVEGARLEYRSLIRAVLPPDPAEAAKECDKLTLQLSRRLEALQQTRRDLWEENPESVDYVWDPVDEIGGGPMRS